MLSTYPPPYLSEFKINEASGFSKSITKEYLPSAQNDVSNAVREIFALCVRIL